MENQGKRLMLAVGLCLGIMGLFTLFAKPKPPKKKPQETAQTKKKSGDKTGDKSAGAGQPAENKTGDPGTAAEDATVPVEAVAKRGPEQFLSIGSGKYTARISSYGGAMASLIVLDPQYATKSKGKSEPTNLVRNKGVELYPLQTAFPDSDYDVPATSEWALGQPKKNEIVATWQVPGELKVVKRYKALPDSYVLTVAIEVTNLSAKVLKQSLAVDLYGYQTTKGKKPGMFTYAPPTWAASCRVNDETNTTEIMELTAPKTDSGSVRWVGFLHKYFLFAIGTAATDDTLTCVRGPVEGQDKGVMSARLIFPTWKLAPGDTLGRTVTVYAGAKLLGNLEDVDVLVGGETEFREAVDWGNAPVRWFSFIGRPMHSLLLFLHRVLGSWGLSIIFLTVLVKAATLYWTTKSMRSMRAMSKLKPEMDALKAKYPDDRQAQQVAMMALYKTRGISPMGGCLPMLLQMPVWMGLYSMLYAAAELYQVSFLWIGDLTAPDPYYILPVGLTLAMFAQSTVSPMSADSTQQKMMKYVMPGMFGFFSLVFPAGLTVYWFTNTALSIGHQFYMNSTEKKAAGSAPVAQVSLGSDAPEESDESGEPKKKRRSKRRRPRGRKKHAS